MTPLHYRHPITGEVVDPDDDVAVVQAMQDWSEYLEAKRASYREEVHAGWKAHQELQELRASRNRPPALPRPHKRTERQMALANCPWCGRYYRQGDEAA